MPLFADRLAPNAWVSAPVVRGDDGSGILPQRKTKPLSLAGYVLPWLRSSNKADVWQGAAARDSFEKGAFLRSLAEIRAGRLSVPLLFEHREGQSEFLHLEGPHVLMEEDRAGLYLAVAADYWHRKGDALAWFLERHPECRFLSASYKPRQFRLTGSGPSMVRRISDADLVEVSLTDSPGMGRECELQSFRATLGVIAECAV